MNIYKNISDNIIIMLVKSIYIYVIKKKFFFFIILFLKSQFNYLTFE